MKQQEKTNQKSASTGTRRCGTNRITNLRYKITDLSQHPQAQPILIKLWKLMLSCDFPNNIRSLEPTKAQLSLYVYSEICTSIFPKALGKFYLQPLILPKPIVFSSVKYERFVIDFISMLGDHLFTVTPQQFEDIVRNMYLHCTFHKNGKCYFRCPEDIEPIPFTSPSATPTKVVKPHKETPTMHDDCFKYEDVLQEAHDKIMRKTNAMVKLNRMYKMKPFELCRITPERICRPEDGKLQQREMLITINKLYARSQKHAQGNEVNQTFITWRKGDLFRRSTGRNKTAVSTVGHPRGNLTENRGNISDLVDVKRIRGNFMYNEADSLLVQRAQNKGLNAHRKLREVQPKPRKILQSFEMVGTKYVPPQRERKLSKRMERIIPVKTLYHVAPPTCEQKKNLMAKDPSIDDMFSPINQKQIKD